MIDPDTLDGILCVEYDSRESMGTHIQSTSQAVVWAPYTRVSSTRSQVVMRTKCSSQDTYTAASYNKLYIIYILHLLYTDY